MTSGPAWGKIAAISLLTMTAVAVVILLTTELEWLAAVIFAFALLDAYFIWRVMPRLTGGTLQSQLDRMNAEAEAESKILDGDWGMAPPSEPAEGAGGADEAPPPERP